MKNDYLKWGALLFALVATASAEYELARAVGFNQWVAAAVPGALDIYTVRAMRAHRDVLAAVTAMIGVNAASHLVTAGLLPVNVPLVVAVSAIAPLVLWRVHRLTDETEVTAPVTVERAENFPSPGKSLPLEVVSPPVICTGPTGALPLMLPRREMAAAVPAETTREVVTEVVTRTPADLRRDAKRLHRQVVRSGGRGVTIDQLRETFGLSRREATDLRREVVTEVAS